MIIVDNNLLRCDLSEAHLQVLDKSGWLLASESWISSTDILLKEWGGFRFYSYNDLFFEVSPLYLITPGGYVIDRIIDTENDDDFPKPDEDGNVLFTQEYLVGLAETAIAALIAVNEQESQLTLELAYA